MPVILIDKKEHFMNGLMNKYKHMSCIHSMYHFSDMRFKVRSIQDISYISPENTVKPCKTFTNIFIL